MRLTAGCFDCACASLNMTGILFILAEANAVALTSGARRESSALPYGVTHFLRLVTLSNSEGSRGNECGRSKRAAYKKQPTAAGSSRGVPLRAA